VIVALAALAPSFLAGGATLPQQAVTLGAVLFAAASLERLTFALSRGAAAWIAWRTMKPMFDSGAKPVRGGIAISGPPALNRVLQAQDIVFTYEGRAESVLKGCSLTIDRGDFLLL
jgi:ABC-type transport system involved in cytochrome bd biosynthesis fused ATPase/permease subunit